MKKTQVEAADDIMRLVEAARRLSSLRAERDNANRAAKAAADELHRALDLTQYVSDLNNRSISEAVLLYREAAREHGKDERTEQALVERKAALNRVRELSATCDKLAKDIESRGAMLAAPILKENRRSYDGLVEQVASVLEPYYQGDIAAAREAAMEAPACQDAFRRTGTWDYLDRDVCGRVAALVQRV